MIQCCECAGYDPLEPGTRVIIDHLGIEGSMGMIVDLDEEVTEDTGYIHYNVLVEEDPDGTERRIALLLSLPEQDLIESPYQEEYEDA